MSRKRRIQSARELKDKRMKRVAAGGAVLLAVVLAFEVPKVLDKGGSSTPPAPTTPAATGAPSTDVGSAAPAVTQASTRLPNSDVAPRPSKSQLYSFSHFAGKDPFVQQVTTPTSPTSPTGTSGTTGTSGQSAAPAQATTAAAISRPAQSSARTLAQAGSATISVNGKIEVVHTGASFPAANPLFRLVSIAHGVARIGIADGSYASGAQSLSLSAGRTLTLVDTTDGVRYKVRLLSTS
jgi:hypothetical protein